MHVNLKLNCKNTSHIDSQYIIYIFAFLGTHHNPPVRTAAPVLVRTPITTVQPVQPVVSGASSEANSARKKTVFNHGKPVSYYFLLAGLNRNIF